ncbi:MAG: phosphotransferase [Pseudomonadota bacterium]|nr:phosphotransferase [Pseudomonadota bacterium]
MGSDRQQKLRTWLGENGYEKASITDLSGDASFRRYYRVKKKNLSYVVMDCPPDKEDLNSFILVTDKLNKAKVNVPNLYEVDQENGFLILSDLGDDLYSKKLDSETVYCLYTDALEAIVKIQTKTDLSELESFDGLYQEENNLFIDWFLGNHLEINLDDKYLNSINTEFNKLNATLKEIPKTFVHRDFHSRNLIVTDANNPGVIDYQDAVIGPVTYDIVSLLKDCYVTWDDGLIDDMLESFFNRIKSSKVNNISDFRYWFDMTGLQRHIKAIGIFSRLNYRDSKDNYLKDIPRTYSYIKKILKKYKDLSIMDEIFSSLDLSSKI